MFVKGICSTCGWQGVVADYNGRMLCRRCIRPLRIARIEGMGIRYNTLLSKYEVLIKELKRIGV